MAKEPRAELELRMVESGSVGSVGSVCGTSAITTAPHDAQNLIHSKVQ